VVKKKGHHTLQVGAEPSDQPEATKTRELRASTISPSQLAIRIKILFPCLVGRERIGEKKSEVSCKSQL
jgi:hypothetical protein